MIFDYKQPTRKDRNEFICGIYFGFVVFAALLFLGYVIARWIQ